MARMPALLPLLLLLAGCAARQQAAVPVAEPSARAVVPDPQLAVWVTYEEAVARMGDEAAAHAFLAGLRQRGVDEVFLQLKSRDGEVGFPAQSAAGHPGLLARAERAAAGASVRIVAVWPMFLGPAHAGEELVEHRWNEATGAGELRKRGTEDMLPRLNPAVPGVVARETSLLTDLARTTALPVCLSHAGFPDLRSDYSPFARRDFQIALGTTIREWPDDVCRLAGELPDEPLRGPLWGDWLTWRALLVRQALFQAETALRITPGPRLAEPSPAVWLMATGYYPTHFHSGVNWATRGAGAVAFPQMPASYAQTAAGDLFDGFVLELFVPAADAQDAEAQELEPWAGVAGALAVANQLVPTDRARRAALAPRMFAGTDGELDGRGRARLMRAAMECARAGWPVLVVDHRDVERWELWDELVAAARAR